MSLPIRYTEGEVMVTPSTTAVLGPEPVGVAVTVEAAASQTPVLWTFSGQ